MKKKLGEDKIDQNQDQGQEQDVHDHTPDQDHVPDQEDVTVDVDLIRLVHEVVATVVIHHVQDHVPEVVHNQNVHVNHLILIVVRPLVVCHVHVQDHHHEYRLAQCQQFQLNSVLTHRIKVINYYIKWAIQV